MTNRAAHQSTRQTDMGHGAGMTIAVEAMTTAATIGMRETGTHAASTGIVTGGIARGRAHAHADAIAAGAIRGDEVDLAVPRPSPRSPRSPRRTPRNDALPRWAQLSACTR